MSLEFNKIAAAVLVTGIVIMATGKISGMLVAPAPLEKNAYVVEGVVADAGDHGSSAAPAAAVALTPITPLLASADADAGQGQIKKCTVCHSFDKGGSNKVGPNLYGIVGHAKGGVAGFAYSDALKAKGGSWDVEALNEFLHNPKAAVPGTKMAFAGIKADQDRANLIKYLQSLK